VLDLAVVNVASGVLIVNLWEEPSTRTGAGTGDATAPAHRRGSDAR
jgi:hypothetical protein